MLTEDEATNAIIAVGTPELHSQLEQLIAELDRRPAQVMIEMTLVAISLSDSLSLGIELEALDLGGGLDFLLFSNFGLSSIDAATGQTPMRAVDEVRANEELLSQIDQALSNTNVPKDLWRDSVPQTPRRDENGQFVIYATRLYFERMDLRQMVAFAHALLEYDPILSISALQLTANDRMKGKKGVWNVEFAVTYRLYAPQV